MADRTEIKVYVVMEDWSCGTDNGHGIFMVFDSEDKAVEELGKQVCKLLIECDWSEMLDEREITSAKVEMRCTTEFEDYHFNMWIEEWVVK